MLIIFFPVYLCKKAKYYNKLSNTETRQEINTAFPLASGFFKSWKEILNRQYSITILPHFLINLCQEYIVLNHTSNMVLTAHFKKTFTIK